MLTTNNTGWKVLLKIIWQHLTIYYTKKAIYIYRIIPREERETDLRRGISTVLHTCTCMYSHTCTHVCACVQLVGFLRFLYLAKKGDVAISVCNRVLYVHVDIFQVAGSSTRLSVFFTVFPHHEFDLSSLTCRLRPGNLLGKEVFGENQVFNKDVSRVTALDMSVTPMLVCR